MSCAQCFEDIGIFSQNVGEQNKTISQLVDERKSLGDRIKMQKKRQTNLEKISLKKLPIFSSNLHITPSQINNYPDMNNSAYQVPNVFQLREKINSKPASQIKMIYSSNSRARTQIPQNLHIAVHRPVSNHQYKMHINYNLRPQRNIIHSIPFVQNRELKKYDMNMIRPQQKMKNIHESKTQDASNAQAVNIFPKNNKEGIQQLKNNQEISSQIQKKISEQFQKDLEQVMHQGMTKIQPSIISHKSKSLIIQNCPYLKLPEINQDIWSSRISRTLSGTRNIQDIMCTKTESVGSSSSSSSQFSQIVLRASNQINNQFKLRKSSTTFNIVEPAPEPSTPPLSALFNSGNTKKTKAKCLMTKRSFSDK